MARRAGVTSPHVPPPDRGQSAPDHHPPHRVRGGGGAEHRRARDRPAPPARAGRRDLDRLVRRRAGIADAGQQDALDRELAAERLVGVPLSSDQVTRYYEGFSNGVLWPLFHYLLDRVPLQVSGWERYVEVNERFCESSPPTTSTDDLIWVHDYQLMLLPGLLRERLPERRIGFFLHIPFPSTELFRTLPARGPSCCEGLLGADLVGFHTPAYLRHFATALTDILGMAVDMDRVQLPGREVRLRRLPDGHGRAAFDALARDPAVEAEAEAHPRQTGACGCWWAWTGWTTPRAFPAGCWRTSGCCRRHPELRERVRLVQVAVPSRTGVEAYQDYRVAGGRAGRPDQRRLRHGAVGAGALHLPRALASRAGGALPRRRRHAGDAAPRRDEPGGQGVRRLARPTATACWC